MWLNFDDTELCSTYNKALSGLLPHENYSNSFGQLVPQIETVIKFEDNKGVYYAFMSIVKRYSSLLNTVGTSYSVYLTRERFENSLYKIIPDLILDKKMDIIHIMEQEGKSGDLSIATFQEEAMRVAAIRVLDLYDEIFELASSIDEAYSSLVELKDVVMLNLIDSVQTNQRIITSTGMRIGREFYSGSNGWIKYTQEALRRLSELDFSQGSALVLESLDDMHKFRKKERINKTYAYYGVPQLDDMTPIKAHRLTVLVARENTGKTKISCHIAANAIRNGNKVYFACGESVPEEVTDNIIASYIFQEYGKYYDASQINPLTEAYRALTLEQKQIVDTASALVATTGLIVENKLKYGNVMAEFINHYNKGYKVFIIDHSQSLRGKTGTIKEAVSDLAVTCRELKNDIPISIIINSHPSTNFKANAQKGNVSDNQESVTAQSSTLSQEADDILIIHEDEYCKSQGLLKVIVDKRRNAPKIPPFYITKRFEVSSYIYDENAQGDYNSTDNDIVGDIDMDFDLEDDGLIEEVYD